VHPEKDEPREQEREANERNENERHYAATAGGTST
jgi:hypothetical protein